MSESKVNKKILCKNTKCIFNKKMYVLESDSLQFCCNAKSKIIRLDKEGKCIIGNMKECTK